VAFMIVAFMIVAFMIVARSWRSCS
jgi:hypothetical protein